MRSSIQALAGCGRVGVGQVGIAQGISHLYVMWSAVRLQVGLRQIVSFNSFFCAACALRPSGL